MITWPFELKFFLWWMSFCNHNFDFSVFSFEIHLGVKAKETLRFEKSNRSWEQLEKN